MAYGHKKLNQQSTIRSVPSYPPHKASRQRVSIILMELYQGRGYVAVTECEIAGRI